MNEAVTDIIVSRSHDADRLSTMVAWSMAAHAVIVALIMLAPETEFEPPPQVMMISLGGAEGPRTAGMTQMGGRAVQAPEPEQPLRRAEAPPAPIAPPMALPDRTSKPAPKPTTAPRDATSRTPVTGEKPTEGSARAETQVRGQGFGLSTGGGGVGGVRVDSDFCCQEYIEQMAALVKSRWDQNQPFVGVTTMKFTVNRDGRITDVQTEKSSGFTQLDLAARRALLSTQRVPPLPTAYPHSTLVVHFDFVYEP